MINWEINCYLLAGVLVLVPVVFSAIYTILTRKHSLLRLRKCLVIRHYDGYQRSIASRDDLHTGKPGSISENRFTLPCSHTGDNL